MDQSMKEIHEHVKKALLDNSQKIKDKVDEKRRDVQFVVGELVMVQLKKARLQKGVPRKIQMRRIGPCKILAKYGNLTYPETWLYLLFSMLRTWYRIWVHFRNNVRDF